MTGGANVELRSMPELPDGQVTFLFTDIEGSTRLWEDAPDLMMKALTQHDEAIDRAVSSHNGVSVKPRGEGDSRFVVFGSAVDAVSAVADMQRALDTLEWVTPRPIRVRASLHTGTGELQMGDYYGSAVNRAARLRAIAHGGQTVMSASTRELVQDHLPPGVSIRDMGEHGLKDLTRPEHVFQVDIDGLHNDFPPLASLGAVPNNLPVQLTEFVGRHTEGTEVQRIIGETRLLTILAPGGAGKTRLAIQVAAEISDDFPDGVFFVDLAAIDSADDIVQTIAESIGIALSSADDLLTQLLGYLARKTQVLVMDNFEHVSEGAGIVSSILTGAPNVKVIATSRSKLNIEGETVMPLAGLDTTWESEEEAFQTAGVELFVDSARRADAGFNLSEDDLEPLAGMLAMVEGMPLAIKLAAAWADMLSIGEVASEVTTTLDFLETESGGVPDRHRSVRAVFEYSWKMLGDEERRVFAALSVFRGGFTREAAETIAGASLRSLANLANKSFLTADRASSRYEVHELLRQYAETELREDEKRWETITEAHIAFYAGLAGRVEDQIGEVEQTELFRTVEADIDNVRLAWRTAVGRRNFEAMRRIIFGLFFLQEVRGQHRAGLSLLEESFESLPDDPADDVIAVACAVTKAYRGRMLASLGQPDLAIEVSGPAVAALAELPDRFAYLMAIEAHCDGLAFLGRWDEVQSFASESVRVAEESDNKWWHAGMLTWLGAAETFLGNGEAGAAMFDESRERLSQLHDDFFTAWSLIIRAGIAMMGGQGGEAVDLSQQVIDLSRSVGFDQTLQIGLGSLGEASLAIGEFDTANDAFMEALAMAEDMGFVVPMAFVMIKLAETRAAMGSQELGVEVLASVLANPASSQRIPTQDVVIGEHALEVLANLEAEMSPDSYQAAYRRGEAKSLEVSAKELLAGSF